MSVEVLFSMHLYFYKKFRAAVISSMEQNKNNTTDDYNILVPMYKMKRKFVEIENSVNFIQ